MKVSIKQYSQTLLDLTENKSQEEVLSVVKKFAEQLKIDGQLKNVGKIMEKFVELYNAKNGIVVAEVVTKSDMGQETKDKVEKFVKEKYSAKSVEIKNIIDEKIKGGIIIKVRDEVMDGSVNAQLNKLKKQLTN